jgi:predicted RNA-binding protein YlxR (DUF448 family)
MKPNYRRCISCRTVAHRADFWRVVRLHPSHQVQLDEGMGRSAYICQNPNCLQLAQKKNRLGRVLRSQIPPDIYAELSQRLTTSIQQPPPDRHNCQKSTDRNGECR